MQGKIRVRIDVESSYVAGLYQLQAALTIWLHTIYAVHSFLVCVYSASTTALLDSFYFRLTYNRFLCSIV